MRMRSAVIISFLIIGLSVCSSWSAQTPSPADLTLYQGKDREKILTEGAKKEGQVTFYTSNTWMAGPVVQEFGKKYPFVKPNVYRADSKELLKRLTEEFSAGRQIADVAETSPDYMSILLASNIFQEFYLPELARYEDEAKAKGKKGVLYFTTRELYISLGFNTKMIPVAEAPKTVKDLLDPKWKNKMTIAGTTTGTQWIGAIMETYGMEMLEKLAAQSINVQNISGAALAELVSSGEVPMSPTIFNSNIAVLKQKGASVEWRPVDPVIGTSGMSALVAKSPHPHAALLFLDFLHSKDGQQTVVKGGLSSARTDVIDPELKFKKFYIESRYPPEVMEKKYAEWEGLKRKLFISKR